MSQSSTEPTIPPNLDPNNKEHFIHFYNRAYANVREPIISMWELYLRTTILDGIDGTDGIGEAEVKEELEERGDELERTFNYLVGKLVLSAEKGEIIHLDNDDMEDRDLMAAGRILLKQMYGDLVGAETEGQVMTFLLLALSVLEHLTKDGSEGDEAEESYEEGSSDTEHQAEEKPGEEKGHAKVQPHKQSEGTTGAEGENVVDA